MASSKIITYDLCNSVRNYDSLYRYIESYSIWGRITESCYFISTDKSCETIRNDIGTIIDSDDRIFVAELTGTAAGRNIICDHKYFDKFL